MLVGEEKRSLGIGVLSLLNCAPIGHNGVRYASEGEAVGLHLGKAWRPCSIGKACHNLKYLV